MSIDIESIFSRVAFFQADILSKGNNESFLVVSVSTQSLFLVKENRIINEYPISTAKNGIGSEENSGKTPLGVHRIAEKIGEGAELGTLFKARKNTREVVPTQLSIGEYSPIDAITTRILWLDGLEVGKNKGLSQDKTINIDSYQRYIYIHGTDEEWRLGKPVSHGCIRMSNHAITKLYDKVCVNTLVVIIE